MMGSGVRIPLAAPLPRLSGPATWVTELAGFAAQLQMKNDELRFDMDDKLDISSAIVEFERSFELALKRFERQITVRLIIIWLLADAAFIAIMKLT
jgi:hypothetical protein